METSPNPIHVDSIIAAGSAKMHLALRFGPICTSGGNRHALVVGDEDDGHPEFALQFAQHWFQDLTQIGLE